MTSVLKEMDSLLAEKAEARRRAQADRERAYADYCEQNTDRTRMLEILGDWLQKAGQNEVNIDFSVGIRGSYGGLTASLQYLEGSWKIYNKFNSRFGAQGTYALDCISGQVLLGQCSIKSVADWLDKAAQDLGIDPPVFSDGSDEPTNAEVAEVGGGD